MIRLGFLLLGTLTGYVALVWGPHLGVHITRFLLLHVVLAGLCLGAWRLLGNHPSRGLWGLVWVGAVLFRGIWLGAAPELSDDIYRYIWDGRMLLEGINPFQFAPAAPEVEPFRDDLWGLINNRHLPTIYPPLLQAVFGATAWVSPTVLCFKVMVTLFDLGTCVFVFLALRNLGRESWAVLYLWNPTVITEFSGQGHSDAVGLCLVALALYATTRTRWMQSGAALAAAALVKFFPLLVLPILWRRLKAKWLLLPVLLGAAYLPFSGHGVNPLGSLGTFAAEWRANTFLFEVLDLAPGIWPRILAGSIVLGAVGVALGRRWPWPLAYSWILGVLLLVSPVVHPWYVLWLLPVALVVRQPAWIVWTFLVPIAYWVLPEYLASGVWVESMWIKSVEYVPVLALVLWQLLRPDPAPGLKSKAAHQG